MRTRRAPPCQALLLVAQLLLALVHPGVASFCDRAYVWLQDGAVRKRAKYWSSKGSTTSFKMGPCLQMTGIGVQVTPAKTLLVLDRSTAVNSYALLPGTNELAFAAELDLETGSQRGLNVITDAFCSSGQFNSRGVFYNVGGGISHGGYVDTGVGSIRGFRPCQDKSCQLYLAGKMAKGRWYATSQVLPDGRIFIIGGSKHGVSLNDVKANVPSVEYFPRQASEGATYLKFLDDTLPYNLFPFVHLLPSGRLFIFAGSAYIIFDTATNKEVPGVRGVLRWYNKQGHRIFRSYPLSGTSALMPLSSSNNYIAEIMICGGGSSASLNRSSLNPYAPADDKCFRIQPESGNATWRVERMSTKRLMPVAVLLPDSTVLILNGVQSGYAGFKGTNHYAALQPDMWDAANKRWYTGPALAISKVPRSYHGSATLVHNASVFVSGSNGHNNIVIDKNDFPFEFRTEFFNPPYIMSTRPTILRAPSTVGILSTFQLMFRHTSKDHLRVVLAHPGFSTHGANHGMRNVLLDIKGVTSINGGLYNLAVQGPPNKNICPPTWYLLFVVVNGIPSIGQNVFVV